MGELDGWLGNEIDPPVFILTAANGERRAGCLVSFATQTSIHPLRFVVFLSPKNFTYRVAKECEFLAVHVVPKHALDLAVLFGGETGDDVTKFDRCSWRPGPAGVPILEDCDTWFVGRVLRWFEAGDHDGVILEPIEGRARPGEALGFQATRDIPPGHEP